jgi:hypothetical protein
MDGCDIRYPVEYILHAAIHDHFALSLNKCIPQGPPKIHQFILPFLKDVSVPAAILRNRSQNLPSNTDMYPSIPSHSILTKAVPAHFPPPPHPPIPFHPDLLSIASIFKCHISRPRSRRARSIQQPGTWTGRSLSKRGRHHRLSVKLNLSRLNHHHR